MRLDRHRQRPGRCLGELHAAEVDAGRRSGHLAQLDGVDEHGGDDPHAGTLPGGVAPDPCRLGSPGPDRSPRGRRVGRAGSRPGRRGRATRAGVVVAAWTASSSDTPQCSTTLRTAVSIVSAEPASVPSASRGAVPSNVMRDRRRPPCPASMPPRPSRARRGRGSWPGTRASMAAGWTCTRSAISETASRSSVSAAPTRPGSRWCSGAIPLKQCVTRRAPALVASSACV